MVDIIKLKKLVFAVTNKCNMRCDYCFESRIDYFSITPLRLMTPEIVDKALDFFFGRDIFKFDDRIQITVFGGEPSLFPEIVRYIASRALSVSAVPLDFSVVTNGYKLSDDFLRILTEFRFHVTVSVDGSPEIHDRQRPGSHNEPTFKEIERNINRLVGIRRAGSIKSLNAEATITSNSLRQTRLIDTVRFLKGLGFESLFVHPASLCLGSPLRPLPDQLREQVLELNQYVLNSFLECNPVAEDLTLTSLLSSLCPGERSCGAGTELFAIDPEGDIYPCQTLVGTAALRMGNILAPDIAELIAVKNKLERAQKRHNPVCQRCAIRTQCGNVCYAHNLIERGDISSFPSDYCTVLEGMYNDVRSFLTSICEDELRKESFVKSLAGLLRADMPTVHEQKAALVHSNL